LRGFHRRSAGRKFPSPDGERERERQRDVRGSSVRGGWGREKEEEKEAKGAAGGREGIRLLSIAVHDKDEDSVDRTERLRTLLANGSTSLVVNGVVAVAATIDDATRRRAPPSVYAVPCSAAVSVVRSVARSSVDRGTPRAKVRDALCTRCAAVSDVPSVVRHSVS
jgi:hypothetical protein